MASYIAPFTFDFQAQRVRVDGGTTFVDVGLLYEAAEVAQASDEGILYGRIAIGSGLSDLGGGVRVGLTVELLESWQLEFQAGAYTVKIGGGNLIGGPAGDPVAYSAGVQTLLIQSAASTVAEVTTGGGSGPTAAEVATAVWQRALEEGMTAEQVLRVMLATLAGKSAGVGTDTEQFMGRDGTTVRLAATFDAQNNRTGVTLNGN